MEKINRIAAFTGDKNIEIAISEHIQWTADFIEENDLKLPNGSIPSDDWAPAMFRPDANLHGFDLCCASDALPQDKQSCRVYGLPEDIEHAVLLALEGTENDLEAFCQNICNMSGMKCCIMTDENDGYKVEKVLNCSGNPMGPDAFIALMFDVD